MHVAAAFVCIFLTGTLVATQTAVNTRLGQLLDSPYQASLISFTLGTCVLLLIVLMIREPWPDVHHLLRLPPIYLVGGLCGAVIVTAVIVFVPHVGVVNVLLVLLAGQMSASLLIDHYGWLGVKQLPIDPWRLVGLLLIFAGVLILNRKQWIG